jgi:hypothetical protein
MLCALRSRRLCERAPSRGTSAAPSGSTATSVTTPRPTSALRSGYASARGRTPFRVTLPDHLNLKVLLDAARRLEKVVVPVVPLKVSGGSTDNGLSPQASADGLADIHTTNGSGTELVDLHMSTTRVARCGHNNWQRSFVAACHFSRVGLAIFAACAAGARRGRRVKPRRGSAVHPRRHGRELPL